MEYDDRIKEWLFAVGYKNLAAVRADLMILEDVVRLIDALLLGEPGYVTHPMSIWNQARRIKLRIEKKEKIPSSHSYDRKTGTWIL